MDSKTSMPRRRFLTTLAAGAAAIPLARLATAHAAGLPHLSVSDPQAKALHYVEETDKLTPANTPGFKKGADCANCQLYQGAAKSEWGPCVVFPGKDVKASGWCSSHVPKS